MDDATSPAAGVHEICDAYVADYARLQPAAAAEFGISGHDDDLPDYSPGRASGARGAGPPGTGRASPRRCFAEQIGLEVELHEAGLPLAALNSNACPVQEVR